MRIIKSIFIKISEHAILTILVSIIGVIVFLIGFYFTNVSISRAEFNSYKIENLKLLSEYNTSIKVIETKIISLDNSFREIKHDLKDRKE